MAATLAATALGVIPAAASAQTLPTHIWVSVTGNDVAGCGPVTAPCRHFQYAHDNIAAGGEIDIASPAGYGALVITKAVTIVNDGVGTASIIQANAGQDAITINDPGGNGVQVVLKGLILDGGGTGNNGITVNAGGSLAISNCTFSHFAGSGLLIQNTTPLTFSVTDVTASGDVQNGIWVHPATQASGAVTTGTVDKLSADGDGNGIAFDVGMAHGTTSTFSLSNSILSNSNAGTYNYIEDSTSSLTVYLAANIFTGNSRGIYSFSSATPNLISLGGNNAYNNGSNIVGQAVNPAPASATL